MKRLMFIVMGMLAVFAANAQDYDALARYMEKYCQNWKTGCMVENPDKQEYELQNQLGTPMPEFRFNGELNSKKLKGKFVVLNFWATWCSGCRILSCDLDTVMRREPALFEGVQVIGVDAHETLADKGYEAEKWWREKGIGYPTVGGKAADACIESVKGGHPTAILVDDQGIIRGRWDAWSPGVAPAIATAIWALKVVPEQGIQPDVETIKSYMGRKDYAKALYLLELIPDAADNSALRYECLVRTGADYDAAAYFKELQKLYEKDKNPEKAWGWKPSEAYVSILNAVVESVFQSGTRDLNVLKNGIDAAYVLLNGGKGSVSLYEMAGVLRVRYADVYRQRGVDMLKTALDKAKEEKMDAAEIQRLEELFEKCQPVTE